MTTTILTQTEEQRPYEQDDDFSDDHQHSPNDYDDGSK